MAIPFAPVPNLGFELYMSEYGVDPVVGDYVAEIQSVSGVGFTVETVDGTAVSSTDGFRRPVPTLREGRPFTITVFTNDDNVKYLTESMLASGVDKLYKAVTIVYPKTTFNADVPDLCYNGFISEITPGNIETGSLQTYAITFTPTGKPRTVTKPSTPDGGG